MIEITTFCDCLYKLNERDIRTWLLNDLYLYILWPLFGLEAKPAKPAKHETNKTAVIVGVVAVVALLFIAAR